MTGDFGVNFMTQRKPPYPSLYPYIRVNLITTEPGSPEHWKLTLEIMVKIRGIIPKWPQVSG